MATSVFSREYPLFRPSVLRGSALFAGLMVALGCQILLFAIGGAIGVSATNAESRGTAQGVGAGALVWMVISPIVSMFLGGLAAGWIARPVSRFAGAFHGILIWCMVGVLAALFLSGMATAAIGSAAGAFSRVVAEDGTDRVGDRIDPQRNNEGQGQVAAKDDKKETRLSAKQKKERDRAAKAATTAAWASVLTMLLSLAAAAGGGAAGQRAWEEEELAEDEVIVRDTTGEKPVHPDDLH